MNNKNTKKKTKTKTKKQSARLEDNKLKKDDKVLLESYKLEYNKIKDISKLIEISKDLLLNLENETIRDKSEYELRYESLGNIMEMRLIDNYKYDSKLMGYPDYEDPDFNIKISSIR